MKTETLQKANELQEEIASIKKHLEEVAFFDIEKSGGYRFISLIPNNTRYDAITLRDKFLPISLGDFKSLYISKAEAELKRLQIEFDKLKD